MIFCRFNVSKNKSYIFNLLQKFNIPYYDIIPSKTKDNLFGTPCIFMLVSCEYIFFSLKTKNHKQPASCGGPRLITSGLICLTSTRQTESGHRIIIEGHNDQKCIDILVVHSPESIPNLFITDCEVTTVSLQMFMVLLSSTSPINSLY